MDLSILSIASTLAFSLVAVQAADPEPPKAGHNDCHGSIIGRIAGTWTLDRKVTERLGGPTDFAGFSFRPDDSVRRPGGKMRAAFEKAIIYQTGGADVRHSKVQASAARGRGYPYLLEQGPLGDLRLMIFGVVEQITDDSTNNRPNTYFSIVLIPAADHANDLMFVGDYVRATKPEAKQSPFAAFKRARD